MEIIIHNQQLGGSVEAPPDGIVKLNVDAAVIAGRFGMVSRNSRGKIVATAVQERNEVSESDMAEVAAETPLFLFQKKGTKTPIA